MSMGSSQLKKGLVVGGLLGGLVTGFLMSKKGKELRAQAQEYAEEMYAELVKKAGELTELSQEKFDELVELLAKEYAKKKEMAAEVKDQVVEALKERWEHVQVEGLFKKVRVEYRALEKQTRENYLDLVEKMVMAYAREKKLAQASVTHIQRELKKRWHDVHDEE